MPKHHPENERIKRKYLAWLEDAKQMDTATADQAAAAISAFEASTGKRDFKAFHIEQARKFKRDLEAAINRETGKPLAKATIRSRLMAVKAFFKWLADQPGYQSRISHADCEYFNPTANDARIATARRDRPVPTLEQIQHVITTAPHATPIEQRDRALIAFALLTGMRDSAMASLPVGMVNLERREVFQDARVVRTKGAKTMKTFFFPVGEAVEAIVRDWIGLLRGSLLFAETDPLFPKTDIGIGADGGFSALGLTRAYWNDASAIRRIFRERFEAAGLPYFHPHSFRKTLARLAYDLKLDLESAKAWSQNLGHDQPITTWTSYGRIEDRRTADIMQRLAAPDTDKEDDTLPPEVMAWFKKQARRG